MSLLPIFSGIVWRVKGARELSWGSFQNDCTIGDVDLKHNDTWGKRKIERSLTSVWAKDGNTALAITFLDIPSNDWWWVPWLIYEKNQSRVQCGADHFTWVYFTEVNFSLLESILPGYNSFPLTAQISFFPFCFAILISFNQAARYSTWGTYYLPAVHKEKL